MPKKINPSDPSNVGEEISKEQLRNYVSRYEKERYRHIVQYIKDDSRAVSISKHMIEEFFLKNPEADGMRIYFGVIDEHHKNFEKGIHNLLFIPTKEVENRKMDRLGDNDYVIVAENPLRFDLPNYQVFICPPGRVCLAGELLFDQSKK